MTTARFKSKTVKKKPPAVKKKSAPKKKPVAKKSPPKPIPKPDKKKAAKPDARAPKPDAKKAPAAKSGPSVRDLAHAERFAPQEARAKKAPKVRPSRAREPGKRPDLPLPTPVERPGGAAGARGEKYVCFSCGAKFYDLGKPEPLCPRCGADQRAAPRQTRARTAPAVEAEVVEERPVKRSRLLDEDEDEIVLDTDAEAADADDLDLGLGVVDEGEDFGPDEPEEEEEPEEP
jgi:hypothetical protein